jgi:hypothetical protein
MLQNALALFEVSAAEQIQVVQDVVELIERKTVFVTGGQRRFLTIGLIKCRLEAPEEPRHRQVSLSMPVVNGRIYQAGLSAIINDIIPAPEITVKDARNLNRGTQ